MSTIKRELASLDRAARDLNPPVRPDRADPRLVAAGAKVGRGWACTGGCGTIMASRVKCSSCQNRHADEFNAWWERDREGVPVAHKRVMPGTLWKSRRTGEIVEIKSTARGIVHYNTGVGRTFSDEDDFKKWYEPHDPVAEALEPIHLSWKNAATESWDTFCGVPTRDARVTTDSTEVTCKECNALPKPRGLA